MSSFVKTELSQILNWTSPIPFPYIIQFI